MCAHTHISASVPNGWTLGTCIVLVHLSVLAIKWQPNYSLHLSFPLFLLVKSSERKKLKQSVFAFTLRIRYGLYDKVSTLTGKYILF